MIFYLFRGVLLYIIAECLLLAVNKEINKECTPKRKATFIEVVCELILFSIPVIGYLLLAASAIAVLISYNEDYVKLVKSKSKIQ